jgi:ABC-type iron transport system FetAB permease component
MTIQIATFLLAVCAALTSAITEGIKKMTNVTKPTLVAAIVAVVVGALVPAGYYLVKHIAFTSADAVYLVGMVVFTWLSSTIGYDKVKQIIEQFIKA